MGGSGGGIFAGSSDPAELARQIREMEERSEDESYAADVNGFLSSLLAKFNDRDIDAINKHLTEIQSALERDLEGSLDIMFGGSVAKHTYVDGLSDIDSLVLLDNCELSDESPNMVKSYFMTRLKERFPDSEVSEGRLAVTIKFSNIEIQLLPAVRSTSGFKIANAEGSTWTLIRPKEFADKLTAVNQSVGSKLIPIIKLAKSAMEVLPETRRLSGYHVESLAIEAFKNYDDRKTLKTMLLHFFNEAAKRVLYPIIDKSGQSVHVDDDLGEPNSLKRQVRADSLARIGRRMRNANAASITEEWSEILGNP